ncbi:ParB N-terminal domain-containing protein [Gluconobacter oxydans]|uniref:ParB/Sulfiredoxin domain-containing protein n=1 Tax=Gluconobacter oxydans NBRC 3293 TaxID=1315969 RepID=A0A829X084_GLUOY|nr:ParB N-terminal domain-containing protein [Gluconobacter oxydans]GEM16522.1 hypothetical protein NBRC3293_1019 [Gluconobacter oxydans NBRC 3293]
MDWDTILPTGTPKEIGVEHLHFDIKNPRFTPDKRPEQNTDISIISKLASTADLSELIQSISTSGYINIEPLIVVLREGRLVVLEGNRRLAALKCLLNSDYARQARISLPEITDKVKKTLKRILVYRVSQEDDEARSLIGFKHINGPQAWDAYAKAQFAGQWLDLQKDQENPLTLSDIANRMGDKHATIHRMVTALYVLRQAEEKDIYKIEDRKKKSFSFSHLYTALSSEEYTRYVGMERLSRNDDPHEDPVPNSHIDKLRRLLIWLYGSKEKDLEPIVRSQNPDLGRLREVLSSKVATTELEMRGDLESALVTATPKSTRFSKSLVDANANLKASMEVLDGFDSGSQEELLEVIENIVSRSKLIHNNMNAMYKEYIEFTEKSAEEN